MNMSRHLADDLYFPTPPARIDRSWQEAPLLPAVAAEYLSEIHRWRARLVAGLAGEGPAIAGPEGLTRRARSHLALLLGTEWDANILKWAAGSAYNIAPFPATAFHANVDDPMTSVMEVLRWRAAVADYLSDVWDVLGAPVLELGECRAMSSFLQPIRMEGRCVFCLSEFDPGRVAPEDHGCVMLSHVRAKWPPCPSDEGNRA